ncbi:ATP-dependent Clp protease ATP-binding subunit [Dorea ammoniilytica]|uniref:ATP-dependent Clp protease ATP-binding subunit n=1 Tax=Dorea ammoniilytica TaxID=2981788 RepID=A0ABT2S5E8_9FIRM|nr:ATP-dependent Clp protease ATP-binding subunit [Dorea ammoniilytica]MCU6699814.1 ATP-dependent Clp protease ATP-binding subunit [Dorea ammoniilytica]SCH51873.1 ATP-dependent Clp protease ATP-binding subunit ClpC [uncultured Eubacterium sp.]
MNYTTQAQEVLKLAAESAKLMQHPYIGTEHLLIGLSKIYSGVAGQVLDMNGVKEEDMLKIMNELVTPPEDMEISGKPMESPRLQFILEEAAGEAQHLKAKEVGTEHLLLAVLNDADCVASRILQTLNVNMQKLYQDIMLAVGADMNEYMSDLQGEGRKKGVLEQFGTDLTEQAAEGKLDPVIGREQEIGRLMQILSRRTKNNPCLVGEPGVGKTAVIEGLAQRISGGLVPEGMKEKKIFTMDLASMLAGSKYRGEFEERMKKLIQEVKAAGNVILFLDEVHTIIGAGGAEGAMDASNILKPSLARGEIQLIGATTIGEYRKYIEKDAALERRFHPVTVEEPTKEQCLEILEGLKSRYENHHHVTVEQEALESAVALSVRYVNDRFLPDKAIDVLDEACSKVSLRGFKVPDSIEELEQVIDNLKVQKEEAIREGNMTEASTLHKEQIAAEKKLDQARNRFQKKNKDRQVTVTEEDIAAVVSEWTKIPVQKLAESESERLRKLEKTLHKRVIGQEEAVTAVAKAVRRGRVGLKDPNRPIGSFLFLGPTGVGKTELSKALAEALFGDENAMIRVDMSEYMEKHSVSKMIGSPPGYVGHDDGGQLSEQVRRHPYSVVLFDEIEKAHPDVFNILLQVLDDGHITDSQGRKVDFRNTVIIMTSNAGAQAIIDPKRLGFVTKEDKGADYKRMKSNVMNEIKLVFRPEFLNRIDEIIVFHSLGTDEMKKITGLMCKEIVKRAKEQLNITLTIRDSVKKHIVETGTDQKYGARPLRRAIQNQLEDALADAILSGEIKSGDHVEAGLHKKEIKFFVKVEA